MALAQLVTVDQVFDALREPALGIDRPLGEVLSMAGMVFYVVPYVFVQLRKLDGNGPGFAVFNAVAAFLVAVSLPVQWNTSSAFIQAFFFFASIYNLVTRWFMSDYENPAPVKLPAPASWSEPDPFEPRENDEPVLLSLPSRSDASPPLSREERAELAAATATAKATAADVRARSLEVRTRLQKELV